VVNRAVDRLYVGKGDKDLYDKMVQESILKNTTRKEQFLLAMAYGIRSNVRRKIEQREEFFLRKDLLLEDEAMLDAIAIRADNALDVLSSKVQIFSIAQEYAHAGIRLLAAEIEGTSYGSFEKKFEKELFETYETIRGRADSALEKGRS